MNCHSNKLWIGLTTRTSMGRFLRRCLHLCKYNYFKLVKGEPNFMMFDSKQFYLKDSMKKDCYLKQRIYMEDEGAAICYAFGVNYLEHSEEIKGDSFKEVVNNVLSHKRRSPKLVVNIGCGLGMIDAALKYANVNCVGIDPSAGSMEGYKQTFESWLNSTNYVFSNQKSDSGIDYVIKNFGLPDTVIMCEAIEHIPESEFSKFWSKIVPVLRSNNGIFIITNGLSEYHFPMIIDGTGWCHIREINNDLYDKLADSAKETLFRYRSHLVLQF